MKDVGDFPAVGDDGLDPFGDDAPPLSRVEILPLSDLNAIEAVSEAIPRTIFPALLLSFATSRFTVGATLARAERYRSVLPGSFSELKPRPV
jgi:hypothetical protein